MNQKIFLLPAALLLFTVGMAQISIIPKPVRTDMPVTGSFSMSAATKIVPDAASKNPAAFFSGYVKQYYGFTVQTGQAGTANAVYLKIDRSAGAVSGAYTLTVNATGVHINGYDAPGVFYGLQSLIQLLPVPDSATQVAAFRQQVSSLAVPFVSVTDYPRFAYRGMHLDVGRHFFGVKEVKKYIDYIALHKMNYFHWHLTDDQGWRIEIKKYPRLTQVGAYRNGTITGHFPGTASDNKPAGGFYTQAEIKDVIAYAAQRYVTIIPEIELPGHASAAIAAYPQLSCFPDSATKVSIHASTAGNQRGPKKVQETWGVFEDVFCPSDYTFKFLEDVLDEVIALFPSRYIHVGGDECPKTAWKKSAFCQDLIKKLGLKDEHALQSYFIQRIEKHVNSKGRNIIGWDEILEGGLAPNATVMSWRGEEGGIQAARQSHNVVMTPTTYVYFDYTQTRKDDSLTIGGFLPLQKVYSYEPLAKAIPAEQTKYILGAQANLWTEYIDNFSKLEYMVFPRMTALSEVVWSPAEGRSWEEFEPRLHRQLNRYRLWGAQYSKAFLDPRSTAPVSK